jgi:FAD synthase
MISVVYPGTFDPPHLGHLDIVKRSCEIFDRVVKAKRKVQLPLTLTLHAFPFYILLHLLQCSVSRQ